MLEASLFFVLGLSALLPWNTLITEAQFFQGRFCGSSLEHSFLNAFTLSYLSCDVVAAVLLTCTLHCFSLRTLVVAPLAKSVTGFTVLAALAVLPHIPYEVFLGVTMWIVVISGLIKSLFLSGCTALAHSFTGSHTSSFLAGMAAAGLVTSAASLGSRASLPLRDDFCDDAALSNMTLVCKDALAEWDSFAYFATSVVVSLFGLLAFAVLDRRRRCRHPQTPRKGAVGDSRAGAAGAGDSDFAQGVAEDLDDNDDDADKLCDVQQASKVPAPSGVPDIELMASAPVRGFNFAGTRRVVGEVGSHLASIVLCVATTLTVFPTVTAETRSTHRCQPGALRFHNDLFTPTLFLLFNVGDLLGRAVADRVQPFSGKGLLGVSVCRLAFLPLFWLSNVHNLRMPAHFASDSASMLANLALGLTNGYVVCACFNAAPRQVAQEERGLASSVMVSGLALGLLIGSLLSLLVWALLSFS